MWHFYIFILILYCDGPGYDYSYTVIHVIDKVDGDQLLS